MHLLLVLLTSLSLYSHSSSLGDSQQSDSLRASAHKSLGGIDVIALITADREVFKKWGNPEMPNIATSTRFKRGDHAIPVIVFAFTSDLPSPYPKLTYNVLISKPDSGIYGKFDNLSVFPGGSAQPRVMYIVNQPIDIGLEKRDPLGVYRVWIEIKANDKPLMTFSDLCFRVVE